MYDLHLERDRFGEGADPGAAVGAVLEGAASVVNAITGAVATGVSQQNEPQILTRNKSDLYAKRLRQVRTLNVALAKKEKSLKAIIKEINKIRRDSAKLKTKLKKELSKMKKWPNGAYKNPIHADVLKNRIKSIDDNGVMISKDARHNHLMHGPDQRNRLREQIQRNQNHVRREHLLGAWGYLTNISAFRPVLALDMSGYGMSVLNVLPANDNLIGKRALTTVYPAFLDSAESRSAAVGRVPIFQRSTSLQTMLTMFGEGFIGTGVWPEAWLLGLTAEELEALPSPGAPLGAIYDIAMEAFPGHYQARRMVVQDGLSVPAPTVSGDGYGSWFGSSFGAVDRYGGAPATAFMNRVLQSIRDGTAKKKIAELAVQATTTAPTPQEAINQLPPSQAPIIKEMVVMDLKAKGADTSQVPSDPLSTAQQDSEPKAGLSGAAKAGIGVGVVALLGTGWYLFSRDE